ncbi:LOW QUALITY PROTEIN: transcription elongation factor A protein 1-like [Branchiostoma floridae]|uniref:Transcription elongation factor n=1 Tax=Branchiostoma floridae TaxID=7739 RepID=A0A9J7HSV1_BRAFL|nr:LOW QUALITY PROTEIN: transcription elongation factor A protein 1-like [Branchiostoma floridae]
MGTEEDVLRIGRKLDKLIAKNSFENALDILKSLKELPMTLDILQKTRIGMSVNNLRKSSNSEEVNASLAKSLIKSWKKLLNQNGAPKRSDSTSSEPSEKSPPEGTKLQRQDSSSTAGSSFSSSQDSFPAVTKTHDSVREKCREMLANALKTDAKPEDDFNYEFTAARIEECIFQEFKNTEMKYKTRVRSRIANLKDAKNPGLREKVLHGDVSAEKMAKMTAEEMASPEMKELRQSLTKEAIRDAQMATTGGTQTDLLKCGKCKKRNVTYNQVQTRSADEPMTTFCYCNECGNRWKFC